MIKQTWNKYMDTQGTCPFHWIHKACMRYVFSDAPRGHMSPSQVMKMGGEKGLCFCGKRYVHIEERYIIFHMSHFQYCGQHRFWVRRTGLIETNQTDVNPMAYLVNTYKP